MFVDSQTVGVLVLAFRRSAIVAILVPELDFALAALRVNVGAGIVLRIAGIDTSLRNRGPRIRVASRRVFAGVEFEWVMAPVRELVIAGQDRRMDVAYAGAGRVA